MRLLKGGEKVNLVSINLNNIDENEEGNCEDETYEQEFLFTNFVDKGIKVRNNLGWRYAFFDELRCKTVYGLRFRTINQRVINTARKWETLDDDLSKAATTPNLGRAMAMWICPVAKEEAQFVFEVTKQFQKSFHKLVGHCKELEELTLAKGNRFSNYALSYEVFAFERR